MKINFKNLFISILIPLGLGTIVGLLTSPGSSYNNMIQPSFAPPGIVFPIVWTILYILMGVSSYIVSNSRCLKYDCSEALTIYYIQLAINLLWSFIFFSLKAYLLGFIWILLLIVLVVCMIKRFYDINKVAGLIQIPYLIWLIFAAVLNFSIFTLN